MWVILTCVVLIIPYWTRAIDHQWIKSNDVNVSETLKNADSGGISSVDLIGPSGDGVEARGHNSICKKYKKYKKHNKFLVPLLVGWVLVKSIMLPLALKGLALLSGKAVVLSLMSLILAAVMGIRRLTQGLLPTGPMDINRYKRKGLLENILDHQQVEEPDPYNYYREQRRSGRQ